MIWINSWFGSILIKNRIYRHFLLWSLSIVRQIRLKRLTCRTKHFWIQTAMILNGHIVSWIRSAHENKVHSKLLRKDAGRVSETTTIDKLDGESARRVFTKLHVMFELFLLQWWCKNAFGVSATINKLDGESARARRELTKLQWWCLNCSCFNGDAKMQVWWVQRSTSWMVRVRVQEGSSPNSNGDD
jgi:hypothetical protein